MNAKLLCILLCLLLSGFGISEEPKPATPSGLARSILALPSLPEATSVRTKQHGESLMNFSYNHGGKSYEIDVMLAWHTKDPDDTGLRFQWDSTGSREKNVLVDSSGDGTVEYARIDGKNYLSGLAKDDPELAKDVQTQYQRRLEELAEFVKKNRTKLQIASDP